MQNNIYIIMSNPNAISFIDRNRILFINNGYRQRKKVSVIYDHYSILNSNNKQVSATVLFHKNFWDNCYLWSLVLAYTKCSILISPSIYCKILRKYI